MSIVENRKARHYYFIEETFEAGIELQGWEVKAIRAGRANLKEAYVIVKDGELFLLGMHVTPLASASTHVGLFVVVGIVLSLWLLLWLLWLLL